MPAAHFDGFAPSLFKFLGNLEKNNNRTWFQSHKKRYESDVLGPALDFVAAMEAPLKKISPFFQAHAKRTGGSVMRIYRDTRFSHDKTPYKLNVGIHFRHEMGRDVHAPGFYVHLDAKASFLGVGIWHPASDALKRIRTAIVEEPAAWKRARDSKPFRAHFKLAGESLKRPPRGVDPDHPLLEDLKRKDFVTDKMLSRKEVLDRRFVAEVTKAFSASKPFMRFLCQAVQVPF